MTLADRLGTAISTDPAHRAAFRRRVEKAIADLIERSGIDLEDLERARLRRLNVWQGFYKDAEGEAHTVDMAGVQLAPAWEEGPAWPVIAPAPKVRLPKRAARPAKASDGWETAVVLPDVQLGYYRGVEGDLVPIHDERAIEVALAVTAAADPDLVVLVGDNLDLAEWGKYRLSPAFQFTTQATIDRGGLLAAQVRAAAPRARIVWLAGNHEERLPNFVLDNAKAAFGIRQANTPDGWPVLSVPHLLNLDDVAVEYLPGYPASAVWINERLRVIHGDRVRSNGSTAHAYLDREKSSVVYGHIHRREWAERTREDHDGPRTIMAASPGCLARIDGAVPSTKGGHDLDGRPLRRHEDWQQGLAVIPYQPGDGRFVYEQVAIHDGWAQWRGRNYQGEKGNQ